MYTCIVHFSLTQFFFNFTLILSNLCTKKIKMNLNFDQSFEDDQDAVNAPNVEEDEDINLNVSLSTDNNQESFDSKEKIVWGFKGDFESENKINLFLKTQSYRTRVTQTSVLKLIIMK